MFHLRHVFLQFAVGGTCGHTEMNFHLASQTAAQVFANKQDSRAGFGNHMKPCFVDSFD